jgi:hypothetical protein
MFRKPLHPNLNQHFAIKKSDTYPQQIFYLLRLKS